MAGGRWGDRDLRAALLESSVFLGPSLILAVQMSGKGFANSFQVGGTIGLTLIWAVALALVFKFTGLPSLPGPRNWGVWAVILVYIIELMAYASIALLCGAVLDELIPGNEPVTVMAVLAVLVALVMLLWRSLGFLEKMIYLIIGAVAALMFYSFASALLNAPPLLPVSTVPGTSVTEDFMLLLGSGSGLSLLLYSVWVSEKIRKVPAGMSKERSLAGIRRGLVVAFLITGLFTLVIMAVATSAGTASMAGLMSTTLGSFPFTVPAFFLAVGILMFGILFVGLDGRARAISRMLRQMGLTRMEKAPLYRALVLGFTSILLVVLMFGQPMEVLALISSISSVMFALVGFALIYLNTKLSAPYRAGWLWISVTAIGSSVFLAIALLNERTMLEFGVPMLLRLAVVALALILLVRSGVLGWMLRNVRHFKGAMIMVVVFGAVSIFGTVGGVEYDGAVVNFRDLGAIMAGALGGPVVGVLVGVVGGAYRYGMGGWTALACFVATVSAGLVSGLFSRYWKGSLSYLKLGFLGLLIEGMHLFLYFPLLTLGQPAGDVFDTLRHVTVPMMVTNVIGLMIFYYCLDRWGSGIEVSTALLIGGREEAEGT
jgi:5TMR of 5TMR-LYT